jgi:hypothetical protein
MSEPNDATEPPEEHYCEGMSILRASNAAIKAENEAAVKNMAALQSELATFKNWQPSDPGTKEAVEKIEARLSAATPGKWTHKNILGAQVVEDEDGVSIAQTDGQFSEDSANMDLIANAPTDLAHLLDLIRAAMVRLEEAEKGRDANAKQALHFESLYLMERDKAEAAEDALDKERLREGI